VLSAVLVALGGLVWWFTAVIPHTMAIFLVGAFIAVGVRPVVRIFERFMPRTAAIVLVYAALIGVFVVLALLIIPATLGQVQVLAANSDEYVHVVQSFLSDVEARMRTHFGKAYLPGGYGDLQQYLTARFSTTLSGLLETLPEVLYQTVTSAVVMISALVLSAFFLLRAEMIVNQFYALFPQRRRSSAKMLTADLTRIVGGFLAGQTLLCVLTGVWIYIGTALLHFNFALLIGIISAVAYSVPFIGMLVVQLLAVILAAPQGGAMVLWVSVIIFVVARLSDAVFAPKILSDRIGVSPIVIMFSVFAGGELFGIPGLLLGIPVAAVFKAAWECFRNPAVATVTMGPVIEVSTSEESMEDVSSEEPPVL
jgi:predicted PurR-regulated permease PerM